VVCFWSPALIGFENLRINFYTVFHKNNFFYLIFYEENYYSGSHVFGMSQSKLKIYLFLDFIHSARGQDQKHFTCFWPKSYSIKSCGGIKGHIFSSHTIFLSHIKKLVPPIQRFIQPRLILR